MQELPLRENESFIRLGQALKASGIASTGSEAKMMISDGTVYVNDEKEFRRGRKIYHGDIIICLDEEIQVV